MLANTLDISALPHNLATRPEWLALEAHFQQIEAEQMSAWFREDSERFARFSLHFGGLLFDYSKNRITSETIELLLQLAKALDLPTKIQALFSAEPLNTTEQRPALHTALRNQTQKAFGAKQEQTFPMVQAALEKMAEFVDSVRAGRFLASSALPIRDVVNIGIGGSHLGPLMTTEAFLAEANSPLRFHFISDIDQDALQTVWKQLDPARTLFIISSKSFTTVETLLNAKACRSWLQRHLKEKEWRSHFVAVTAVAEKAKEFGLKEEQIFPIWDWVGGRYSIWSAIGLPLALQIGMEGFQAFLEGAHHADLHFYTEDLSRNIPVLMALLGVWYINFFQAKTQALIPYASNLKYLRAYLQQLDMESNGKRITQQGEPVSYATGPIIWGELGLHGQHAFHQLLHQGTHLVPVDFILVGRVVNKDGNNELAAHQDLLIANALSQAQALMQGKDATLFAEELAEAGYNKNNINYLANHKEILGNKPSTIFFMDCLTPRNLGTLLAFYEHKIFVQSVIWNINPFDQWGVELGKTMVPAVLAAFEHAETANQHDASTRNLIKHYKNLKI